MDSNTISKEVQDHYGSIARADKPSYSDAIAQAFGYTEEELNSIPHDANLGLSCGNPLAIASLREASIGETVIDLGSGAGFDIFLAANKVGPTGRAIGVDINKDMLARARGNHVQLGGVENVAFVEGNITSIPLEDSIADCIISNCVINLVPEPKKPVVFTEMARLLKPGGRVAISDILARKPFPAELRNSVTAYVGCVAGCGLKEDYERFLTENGFRNIVILDAEADLNVYTDMAYEGKQGNGDVTSSCGPGKGATFETTRETVYVSERVTSCGSKTSNIVSKSEQRGNISAPEAVEGGCCSEVGSKMHSGVAPSWSLADIDINEWAGSFRTFAIKT